MSTTLQHSVGGREGSCDRRARPGPRTWLEIGDGDGENSSGHPQTEGDNSARLKSKHPSEIKTEMAPRCCPWLQAIQLSLSMSLFSFSSLCPSLSLSFFLYLSSFIDSPLHFSSLFSPFSLFLPIPTLLLTPNFFSPSLSVYHSLSQLLPNVSYSPFL